jgi:hypothetical protein
MVDSTTVKVRGMADGFEWVTVASNSTEPNDDVNEEKTMSGLANTIPRTLPPSQRQAKQDAKGEKRLDPKSLLHGDTECSALLLQRPIVSISMITRRFTPDSSG